MLTSGFKLFFGFCVTALLAAFVFGYTTGGRGLGPVTLGIDGAVGNHLGYVALLGVAVVSGGVALTLAAFRDADGETVAELLRTDTAPAARPAQPSYWPLIGALGAGTAVVGLVVHGAVFVIGAVIVAGAAVEWTMQAWADRASGDPEVNRRLRDRIMHPVELPIAAALSIVLVPLAMSRVFIAVSKLGASYVATIIASAILLVAAALYFRPRASRNIVAGIVLIGGLALLGAGIAAAVIGERDIEPIGSHAAPAEVPVAGTGDVAP